MESTTNKHANLELIRRQLSKNSPSESKCARAKASLADSKAVKEVIAGLSREMETPSAKPALFFNIARVLPANTGKQRRARFAYLAAMADADLFRRQPAYTWRLFEAAIKENDCELVCLLIAQSTRIVDQDDNNIFHLICRTGSEEMVNAAFRTIHDLNHTPEAWVTWIVDLGNFHDPMKDRNKDGLTPLQIWEARVDESARLAAQTEQERMPNIELLGSEITENPNSPDVEELISEEEIQTRDKLSDSDSRSSSPETLTDSGSRTSSPELLDDEIHTIASSATSSASASSSGPPDYNILRRIDLELINTENLSLTRQVISSRYNVTPTRQIRYELDLKSLDPNLSVSSQSRAKPSKVLRDMMLDDGKRRIQILYYQMLAYWEEGCNVQSSKTTLQHGRALIPGFNGAHSALLPNLRDDHLIKLCEKIVEDGITPKIEQKLKMLGFSSDTIETLKTAKQPLSFEVWDEAISTLSEHDRSSLISESTHLYHVANATIEMPRYVNQYHTLFEQLLRREAIRLINEVSMGRMNPYHAVSVFSGQLLNFLEISKEKTEVKLDLINKLDNECQKMQKLQVSIRRGAIHRRLKASYVACIRNLAELRQLLTISDDYTLTCDLSLRYKKEEFFFAEGRTIIDWDIETIPAILLQPDPRLLSAPEDTVEYEEWEIACSHYQEAYDKALEHAAKELQHKQITDLTRIREAKQKFTNCLDLINILQKASKPPPYEALSGVSEGKTRRGLTLEELRLQKDEILVRQYRPKHLEEEEEVA